MNLLNVILAILILMGASVNARIERQTPGFDEVKNDVSQGRKLMAALGKRGDKVLRAHFLEKDRQGNRRGWPRSHFWSRRVRAATALTEITSDTATIDIGEPAMRQKIYGGQIDPKESKYLAIPARAEAAGRSPRLFDDLVFIPVKRGDLAGLLVKKAASGRDEKGRNRAGGEASRHRAYYFLLTKVVQSADPTALPDEDYFRAQLLDEASMYLARRARRA